MRIALAAAPVREGSAPGEAAGEDTAAEAVAELARGGRVEERLEVIADDPVQNGALRPGGSYAVAPTAVASEGVP